MTGGKPSGNSKPSASSTSSASTSTLVRPTVPSTSSGMSSKAKNAVNSPASCSASSSCGICRLPWGAAVKWTIVSVLAIFGLAILAGTIAFHVTPRTFNLDDLHAIANRSIGLPKDEMFNHVILDLQGKYGNLIHNDSDWMFVCAGGFKGAIKILYASLTEYVLLYGTAIGTDGHSGRYAGDVHDWILTGSFKQWPEGTTEYTKFVPGQRVDHWEWTATCYEIEEHSWMLEYSQGVIPSYLPFALGDTIFSTQDFITLAQTFKVYGRLIMRSLLQGRF